MYWTNEQKCRKYTKIIGYYIFLSISGFVSALVYALCCIASGNFGTSSWQLPLYMILPFDETRVLGWLLAWFTQVVIDLAYVFSMISITSYFVSCCLYIVTLCDHFKLMMNRVNSDVDRNQREKNPQKIRKNRFKITKQLRQAIKFHATIFE